MSEWEGPERRRFPRVEGSAAVDCRLRRRVRVTVQDVSATGALLGVSEPLPVGATGRLQVRLGDQPFDARIEVVREDRSGGARRAGVALASVAPAPQAALDLFLRRAQE